MKSSFNRGFGFGITSGIITTLGLMIGLYSGTYSKIVVLGGIVSIAIADALSDALGIHISEEAGNKKAKFREIWECTISTFAFKFIFASLFVIPILLFELQKAIYISVALGFLLLGFFSYYIAVKRKTSPWKAVLEHLGIAIVVIVITYLVGKGISIFGGI
ncbi:hypothetical protein K9L16_02790 [Candidatus Pacearchaeota archaeon]|nr:hypothetical protein [Candidatus Pacearchaeota archaeon]